MRDSLRCSPDRAQGAADSARNAHAQGWNRFEPFGVAEADSSQYGRAFSLTLLPNELPPPTVPARVVSKLALFTPSKDLVDAYLGEIARGYNVDWLPESTLSDSNPVEGEAGDKDATGGDVDGEGGPKETPVAIEAAKMPMPKPSAKGLEARSLPAPPDGPEKDAWASSSKGSEEEELAKRFERLKNLR
jgi:vacuolar protein sorting-associated protein IST1